MPRSASRPRARRSTSRAPRGTGAGRGVDRKPAAQVLGAFAHADQADIAALFRLVDKAASVVPDAQYPDVIGEFQPDPDLGGFGMPRDVGQGFLQHAEQRRGDGIAAFRVDVGQRQFHRNAGACRELVVPAR